MGISQIKPGEVYITNLPLGDKVLFVNIWNDLIYKKNWTKYLEEQREIGRRSVAALAIQARFELGLPLHDR